MKQRKLFALLLVLALFVSLLAGCGAKAENMAADAPAAAAPMESPMREEAELTDASQADGAALPTDRKLITTVNMEAETEDLDAMLAHITGKTASLNGYVESQETYNGSMYDSRRYRYASLTVRIPAENLSQFVDLVTENCNIISNYRTSEDVTLSYVSIESRIEALEVEQQRLLELMEKAEKLEDLLTIEARLTDVRYELEQITSQLRVMDNQINYSTIHLRIQEVSEYTEVEEEPETVWQRIATGFRKSLKNVGKGIENLFVFFIVALPYLVPIAAVVIVVALLITRGSRKKTDKKPKDPTQNA